MAHLGGGAEAHARSKQYEYRTNSSLILTTDSHPCDTEEPTGEPESLRGKIDPKSFGDRVARGRDPELNEKLKKYKRKEEQEEHDSLSRQTKRCRLQEESVLTPIEEGVYQPKTKVTKAAYEAMLGVIQQQLGGQHPTVAFAAADEILAILKNGTFDKKREIDKLLNPIPDKIFDQLVSIGRLITDYQDLSDSALPCALDGDDALDNDIGIVAVEFEENCDDYDESDPYMVQEDDDEDEPIGMSSMRIDDEDMQDANEDMNVQDIDAYWLQRKISQAYGQQTDPQQCQKLAEEVLKTLAEGDEREVETNLLKQLEFERFSLIKFLLRNRLKIVWCTRLARAEDQEERKKIEEEMVGLGPDLAAILEQLLHESICK